MSVTIDTPRPLVAQVVQWAEVEPGFCVGTRDGKYLGFIESTAYGTFVAVDGFSTPVGRYFSLREAKRALTQLERIRTGRPRASAERMARRLATASGLAAATMMLTAGALFLPA